MKNKILIIVSLLLLATVTAFIWQRQTVSPTDAEIRDMFECDRFTKEAKATDYYCSNPDAYRKDKPIPSIY